ncbi:response regulator [Lacihabitans lacunae]|uniref:Response regulator n=1 Tax=Lacihabitans lacunae TaxID=1028214 RepID=A0ABV7Z169_9BACT
MTTPIELKTVVDGEQLMAFLKVNKLPDVLFLDLNMPRKNGFECLTEIRLNTTLDDLPIIIFSTSFEQEVVNRLYLNGAKYFILKPAEFSQFKNIIHKTIRLILEGNIPNPSSENFVLTLQSPLFK